MRVFCFDISTLFSLYGPTEQVCELRETKSHKSWLFSQLLESENK